GGRRLWLKSFSEWCVDVACVGRSGRVSVYCNRSAGIPLILLCFKRLQKLHDPLARAMPERSIETIVHINVTIYDQTSGAMARLPGKEGAPWGVRRRAQPPLVM